MEDKDFVVAIASAKVGVLAINSDGPEAQNAINDAVNELNRLKAGVLRAYSNELKGAGEKLGVEGEAALPLPSIVAGMESVANQIDPDVDTGQ